jgi:hypothetical protein
VSPTPLALAAVPSGPIDPGHLAQHLEICRLHAELELLEGRIRRLQSAVVPGDDALSPFTDRAQDLVDRMVDSLYTAGRGEIIAESTRTRIQAEARVEEARQRADEMLTTARDDLAVALAGRAEAVDAARALGLDVIVLTEPELAPATPLAVGPEPPPAPVEAPVEPDAPVLLQEPSVPPRRVYLRVPGVTVPATAATAAPADPAPVVVAPADPVPADDVQSATAVEVEAARTDAAFEAWMAVAPPLGPPVPKVDGKVAELGATEHTTVDRRRSRWVRVWEVVAGLIAVAIIVVMVLLAVG